MNNPFENPNPPQLRHPSLDRLRQGYAGQAEGGVFVDVSEPSIVKGERGGLTINEPGSSTPDQDGVLKVKAPFIKAGIESPGYESRRQDLPPNILSYVDRLHARVLDICKKYGAADVEGMYRNALEGKGPGLKMKDAEEISKLLEDLEYILDHKDLSPLKKEKEDIREGQRQFLIDWFGKEFPVPPLHEGITKEMLDFWKKNLFELRYWPRIRLREGDDYPGWKHKLGKRNNPEGLGIEFYDELDKIKNLPENLANPSLEGLETNELPGRWMLCDARKKPDYCDARQEYEDDALVYSVLRSLPPGFLNDEASACLRNRIDPSVFSRKEFWDVFKSALRLEGISGSAVRLPRVIEANAMGQGPGWHDTSTSEWCEEKYGPGRRLVSGFSSFGGASYVKWDEGPLGDGYGFRPLVIFPPTEE